VFLFFFLVVSVKTLQRCVQCVVIDDLGLGLGSWAPEALFGLRIAILLGENLSLLDLIDTMMEEQIDYP